VRFGVNESSGSVRNNNSLFEFVLLKCVLRRAYYYYNFIWF